MVEDERNALSLVQQVLDAQKQCVPCKLCGGHAIITDAGLGAGYYIRCVNNRGFRPASGCLISDQRLGGWAYNVMEWWNRLHQSAQADAGGGEDVVSEAMWGGLARQIMMWLDMHPKTPRALFRHLESSGYAIPNWLRDEPEMQSLDHVPSKGTRCVLIFKAMRDAGSGARITAEALACAINPALFCNDAHLRHMAASPLTVEAAQRAAVMQTTEYVSRLYGHPIQNGETEERGV